MQELEVAASWLHALKHLTQKTASIRAEFRQANGMSAIRAKVVGMAV